MPPGVTTANSPGALAEAADGTQVRGRFGNRASGHGIGSRNIDHHPLARSRQDAIDDAVREIEKACAQADNGSARNHLRQLPQFPCTDHGLSRHSNVTDVDRRVSVRAGKNQTSASQRRPVGSLPIPPANSSVNSPISSPVLSARTMDSTSAFGMGPYRPSSPHSHTRRMQEPANYAPAIPPPCLDTYDRTRDPESYGQSQERQEHDRRNEMTRSVEQYERDLEEYQRRRRGAQDRYHEEGGAQGCWGRFCLCCCDYDNIEKVHIYRPVDPRLPQSSADGGTAIMVSGCTVRGCGGGR